MNPRSVRRAALAAGLLLGLARSGPAQIPPPPNLPGLVQAMGEQVRRLGEEIRQHADQVPGGAHLLEDTGELRESLGEFRGQTAAGGDLFRARQAYSGVDGSWHHLRGMLARLGPTFPDIEQAAARVDAVDGQLHAALGLNPPPPAYYAAAPPAAGVVDVRRLAHALVDRSQELAAVIPVDLANSPDAGPLAQVAIDLAGAADRFHDTLDGGQPPAAVGVAYGPVIALIDRLAPALAAGPPRVQQVWQRVAGVDAQIRQGLGLGAPAIAAPAAPPLQPLADQLLGQVDAFLRAFTPIVNDHPANPGILAEAQRLRAEAADFRRDVARGLDAGRLAYEYRDVDATWQRMWRRIERASRGRNGPVIELAREIGPTCAQIHQALGLPGYSPTFAPAGP